MKTQKTCTGLMTRATDTSAETRDKNGGKNRVVKRTCNKCGREFDEFDEQHDIHITKDMGYPSKYDGERVRIDLCVDCADKLIDECRVNPIE